MKMAKIVKRTALLFAVCLVFMTGCSMEANEELKPDEKLIYSILADSLPVMKQAVEEGADVNDSTVDEGNLYILAGKYEGIPLQLWMEGDYKIDMLRELLEAGADVNACDEEGNPLIFFALYRDSEPMCRMLLQYGADLALKNQSGESPLEYYIRTDEYAQYSFPDRSMVKMLIEQGVPVDARTLEYGVRYRAYHILDLLYAQNKDGFTKLQQTYLEGKVQEGNRLLKSKDTPDEMDLYLAAVYGNRESVKILGSKKTDYFSVKGGKPSMIEAAARKGNLETVSAMADTAESGTNINKVGLNEVVCRSDDAGLLQILYEKGIFSQKSGSKDRLESYAGAGAIRSMEWMLKHGNEGTMKKDSGNLLELAVFNNDIDMIKLLLEYGADPNALGDLEDTPPFVYACEHGNTDILELFIENGADLDTYGEAAMSAALSAFQMDIVKVLAKEGVKMTRNLYEECLTSPDNPSDEMQEYVKELYEQQNP